MSIYLQDISLQEAQSRLDQALAAANLSGLLGIEDILLDENAVGRVLAEAIWAKISSPNYHAAAMDGYAIRSAETAGATLGNPSHRFEEPHRGFRRGAHGPSLKNEPNYDSLRLTMGKMLF